jgi:arylformamidase
MMTTQTVAQDDKFALPWRATYSDRNRYQMRIYDVSVPISARTPTYPGDPGIEIGQWLSMANGDPANVSVLHFGAHTGTHVDAPAHFIQGATEVKSLKLETLIGEAEVIEIPSDVMAIDHDLIATCCPTGARRVLFKTRNSSFWNETNGQFRSDYTHISPDGARRLVADGVQLVGIDYLSVERFKPERFETHETLLSNGVVIIEGLDLREVPAGKYELICLPLKIAGGSGDGAPARTILRTFD